MNRSLDTDLDPGKGATYQQAKVANAMINVQKSRMQLQTLQDSVIDRSKATEHIQRLAQAERQSWIDWCESAATECAEALAIDRQTFPHVLTQGVNDHFREIGDIDPQLS
jgi:hypothetical protein